MDPRDPPPDPSSPPGGGGGDGVRISAHPRRGRGLVLGLLAFAVVAGLVGYRLVAARNASMQQHASGDVESREAPGARVGQTSNDTSPAAAANGAGGGTVAVAAQADGEDATPDLSDYVLPGEAPTMQEVITALHARGIRTGLGAFPPPGTSPPLEGLEVPEGFTLPPGYVRHHQATDDGQRIAPILMFHPDLRFVEVGGRRVPVPADRVVPPELAPPGLPLRRVRIPPPRDGGPGP